MKTNRLGYYLINIIIMTIAVGVLMHEIYSNVIKMLLKEKGLVIVVAFFGVMFIYVIKAIRLYVIMLERRLSINRFINIYIKTTLVNLALPFKLGELFRVYCYGNEMKSYKLSILCVIIDRYFDTVPLIILLGGFTLMTSKPILLVVMVLLLFIIFMTVIYIIFPSSYRYMNRFLVMESNSKKGLRALVLLDKANNWYEDAAELIKGRGTILLILSSVTWLMECGILAFLAWGMGGDMFKMEEFVDYINSVFVGRSNQYVTLYVGLSAVLVTMLAIGVYGFSLRKGRK